MRIVLTCLYSPWSYYHGGGQTSTLELAHALYERGHEVIICYSRSPLESINVPKNIKVSIYWVLMWGWKSRRQAWSRRWTPYSYSEIILSLHNQKPIDIIHAQGEEMALLTRRLGSSCPPIILTPRYSNYPTWYHEKTKFLGWSIWRKWLFSKFYWLTLSLKTASLCIPPSRWAMEKIKDRFPSILTSLSYVHNGVPSWGFVSSKPIKVPRHYLLFFGRFHHDKGIDILLKAFKKVCSSAHYKCVLIGRGPEKRVLKNLTHKLGIRRHVIFLPWCCRKELFFWIQRATLTLFPSREENCSLAILESMLHASAVVSTSVGGTVELIEHKKTGWLVSPNSVSELAQAIIYLLKQRNVRNEIGQRAKKHVTRNHTWVIAAEKFERLYYQLL